MAEETRVVEITRDNLCELPCCGIKDAEHEGRIVKTRWMKTYLDKGLTIICANQCPYTVRFADMAEKTYKLKPKMVELRTYRDAQNALTPCASFAAIYNGQLPADHQISATRFRNIMDKIL